MILVFFVLIFNPHFWLSSAKRPVSSSILSMHSATRADASSAYSTSNSWSGIFLHSLSILRFSSQTTSFNPLSTTDYIQHVSVWTTVGGKVDLLALGEGVVLPPPLMGLGVSAFIAFRKGILSVKLRTELFVKLYSSRLPCTFTWRSLPLNWCACSLQSFFKVTNNQSCTS